MVQYKELQSMPRNAVLERMNPAEAERKCSLRLQKGREARTASLNANFSRERAHVQAKFLFEFWRL
jgi:hypothetical protein